MSYNGSSLKRESHLSNYYIFDIAKFIAAIFVVMIHCSLFYDMSEVLNFIIVKLICALAVPFFFITSGYFFYRGIEFENLKIKNSKENIKRLKKNIKRLLLRYCIWTILYMPCIIIRWINTGYYSLFAYVDFGISLFIKPSYYHLWYVTCLMIALPISYFILRYIGAKFFLIMSIVLYIIGLLPFSYSWLVPGEFNDILLYADEYKNIFWTVFRALPLSGIGLIPIWININRKKAMILFIISLALLTAESTSLYLFVPQNHLYSYLVFTITTTLFVFCLLKTVNLKGNNKDVYIFLRKLSSFIFFIHPMILFVIQLTIGYMNTIVLFIIVLASALLLGTLILKLSKRFNFLTYLF